ncbi:hypothetical protein [Thermoactinomyces mirandus]|uniref:hypothetical protein n=1 Tax=Thermoactinomyces mirandus TaxID=2756294 RepID=UPI0015EEF02E|nr:hypothetical protein [Thermoactinomyces mirandus]
MMRKNIKNEANKRTAKTEAIYAKNIFLWIKKSRCQLKVTGFDFTLEMTINPSECI